MKNRLRERSIQVCTQGPCTTRAFPSFLGTLLAETTMVVSGGNKEQEFEKARQIVTTSNEAIGKATVTAH
ncbi:hypothetical protein PDIDSM_8599 [Penicillium digitatum]|nr:hypothetical protein PDIDSM_8599 [Penicillium digitatum]